MSRYVAITIILSAALCLLLVATADAKVFRFEDSYEYSVEAGFKLTVNNSAGAIIVSRQEGDKVIIKVTKETDASSRKDAEEMEDRIEVVIDAKADRIEIDTRQPDGKRMSGFFGDLFGLKSGFNGSVNYQIEIPTSVDLAIASTSGDVELHGIEGKIRIAATSSDITIRTAKANCDIKNTSGDIRMKDITGNIDVMSTSSDAVFDNVQGDIDLQATSGDTEAHWVTGTIRISKTSGNCLIGKSTGDVDVRTISGNIEIDQREGGFSLTTSSGDIRVDSEFANGSRFEAETTSGNIVVRMPAEAKGDVRLETTSGNIDTNLALEVRSFNRNRLEGRLRGGGTGIFLTSTSGDISLEEY